VWTDKGSNRRNGIKIKRWRRKGAKKGWRLDTTADRNAQSFQRTRTQSFMRPSKRSPNSYKKRRSLRADKKPRFKETKRSHKVKILPGGVVIVGGYQPKAPAGAEASLRGSGWKHQRRRRGGCGYSIGGGPCHE